MTVVKSVRDGLRDCESETQLNLNRPLRISPGPRHLSPPLAAISTYANMPAGADKVPGVGATTVISYFPDCISLSISFISILYSFAVIVGLLKPNLRFNIFDIYDQLLFIKNTSSADGKDFTISLILTSSLVTSFKFFINFLLFSV
jgi:hypothetical protein